MLNSKEVLEMEQKLKSALSIGFFEHGTHTDMDLVLYAAYDEINHLRILLEAYEDELRKESDDLKKELRGE